MPIIEVTVLMGESPKFLIYAICRERTAEHKKGGFCRLHMHIIDFNRTANVWVCYVLFLIAL